MNFKAGDIVVSNLEQLFSEVEGSPFRLWKIIEVRNTKEYKDNHWEVYITMATLDGATISETHQYAIRHATPTEIILYNNS